MPAIDASPTPAVEKTRSVLNRNRAGNGYLGMVATQGC